MVKRVTRLRWRRVFRRKQRQVEGIGAQAEQSLERLFIRRLNRLLDVRRFAAGWVALMVLLCVALVGQFRVLNRTFQSLQPVEGGIYSEGMMGTFTNANPLYVSSPVDATASRLVFAGLLTHDQDNKLVGDLATSWSVDGSNKVYTVVLREGLTWHDGVPLTADDVVYTFQTAQNPDAKSPLFRSWNGITIKALDERTVEFTLRMPFAPFPHSLTTGIIPKHILADVPVSELRSSQFNTRRPIGAGPFEWGDVELVSSGAREGEQQIGLKPFAEYHQGAPHIGSFIIRTYRDQARLVADFRDRTITAIVGLDQVPETLEDDGYAKIHTATVTAEVMAFFRTDGDLLKDKTVRQALVRSVNPSQVVSVLAHPTVLADSPLLKGQLGHDPRYSQLGFDVVRAKRLLDQAGWKQAADGGIRTKGNTPLAVRLVAQSTPEFTSVTAELQKAWRAVGVDVQVSLVDAEEVQTIARDRNYDILLYGISIGPDPDVFAYWHSTQSDPRSGSRLNFSHYKSPVVDNALEAGRSREDPALRVAKYKPFLEVWRVDAPALALYQPQFVYITNIPIYGFDKRVVNTGADRFADVHQWMIRQELRPKP